MEMSRYMYPSTLDASRIRLLRFANNSATQEANSDQLRLHIIEYPLCNPPPYHALSYTWGPPKENDREYEESDKVPITLNDERFDVFPNLYHALNQVRLHELLRSEYFWVDAICINQMNIPERGIQVDIMDHIYKNAVQVDIWLGEEDGFSSQIVVLVAKMAFSWFRIKEDVEGHRPITRLSNLGENASLVAYNLPLWTDDIWIPFIIFFQRSWFRRIWVIQEIALAKKIWVMLGKSIVDWSYVIPCSNFLRFTGLARSLSDYATRIPMLNHGQGPQMAHNQLASSIDVIEFAKDLCQRDSHLRDPGSEYHETVPILDNMLEHPTVMKSETKSEETLLFLYQLLHMTSEFRCTDARDRVFALLGMVNCLADIEGRPRLPFRSDYGPGSTPATAFLAVTKAILEQFQQLDILALAYNSSGTTVTNHPSWVPDFGLVRSNRIISVGPNTRFGKPAFDPCKYKSLGQLGLRVEGQRLYVKAFQIDVVKQQTRSWVAMFQSTHCEDLARLVISCPPIYTTTGQSRIEVLWRTIIYDTGLTTYPAEHGLQSSFRYWLAQHIITSISRSTEDWHKRFEAVKSLANLENLASSDSSQTIPTLDLLESCLRKASEIPSDHGDFRDHSTLAVAQSLLLRGSMPYEELGSRCIAGRLLFVSEEGYFGSGPESMEIGDTVWAVSGSSSLLVFRKHPSDATCYQLVGEAYIHGLMHGEAVKEDTNWKEVCLI